MDKIIGMGNALVDVLVTLQGDALLDEMNLPKGSMQLIDEAKFLKIRNKFADVKTHKATGALPEIRSWRWPTSERSPASSER